MKKILSLIVIMLMIFSGLLTNAKVVNADDGDLMTLTETASGEVNGPFTITLTAQQNREAQGYEKNFTSQASIKTTFSNPIVSDGSTTVTLSDEAASYTFEDGVLEVTGYDYHANMGKALTVTITNAVVDEWRLANNQTLVAGELTDIPVFTSWKDLTLNDGQHTYAFPDAYVSVVKLATPNVKVNSNRTATWGAVEGATSYSYEYWRSSDYSNKVTGTTTETSIDISSFISTHGADTYTVRVYAHRGGAKSQMGQGYLRFVEVKATPIYKNKESETYYEAGTTGGTVAGKNQNGLALTAGENGVITGVFAEGDTIELTASHASGYTFQKYLNIRTSSGWVESTNNPETIELAAYPQNSINVYFLKDPTPITYATVTLEMGLKHATLAASANIKEFLQDICGYKNVTASGTTITMSVPTTDDDDDPITVRTVQNRILSAVGVGLNNSNIDANELFYEVGRQTIDKYESVDDLIQEKYNEESGLQIADGQKFYALWFQPISEFGITIEPLMCGTEVTGSSVMDVTPRPNITFDTDLVSVFEVSYFIPSFTYSFWLDSETQDLFIDTADGEKEYIAFADVTPEFGYYFADGLSVKVNSEPYKDFDYQYNYLSLNKSIKAVHVIKDPVIENVVPATCTEGGSHDEVGRCSKCEKDVRQTIYDKPLGHDYGDWEIVVEPQIGKEGLKRKVCKHDNSHVIEETIPALEPDKYVITYDLSGGTLNGKTGVITETYDEDTMLTLPKPYRDGYTFEYWEGSKYYAGDKYKVTENHKFKAIWKKVDVVPYVLPKTGIE